MFLRISCHLWSRRVPELAILLLCFFDPGMYYLAVGLVSEVFLNELLGEGSPLLLKVIAP